MTDAAAPAPQTESSELLQLWNDSFSQVLGQIAGSAVACAVEVQSASDAAPAAESDLWIVVTLSGSLRGEMTVRLDPATTLGLAQIFMSEAPTPGIDPTADHREAVIELLRQVSGIVSTASKARWGEVQLRVEQVAATPSWPAAATFLLQAGESGPARMTLEFSLSAALIAELKTAELKTAELKRGKPNLSRLPLGLPQIRPTFPRPLHSPLRRRTRRKPRRARHVDGCASGHDFALRSPCPAIARSARPQSRRRRRTRPKSAGDRRTSARRQARRSRRTGRHCLH